MEDEVCRAGGSNDMSLFGEMNHWCGRLDGERMIAMLVHKRVGVGRAS